MNLDRKLFELKNDVKKRIVEAKSRNSANFVQIQDENNFFSISELLVNEIIRNHENGLISTE